MFLEHVCHSLIEQQSMSKSLEKKSAAYIEDDFKDYHFQF